MTDPDKEMARGKCMKKSKVKGVRAWAFLNSNGQIRATTLPQAFKIFNYYPKDEWIEVEIRPLSKRKG